MSNLFCIILLVSCSNLRNFHKAEGELKLTESEVINHVKNFTNGEEPDSIKKIESNKLLSYCFSKSYIRAAELIINKGININYITESLLNKAVLKNDEDFVRLLSENSFKINTRDLFSAVREYSLYETKDEEKPSKIKMVTFKILLDNREKIKLDTIKLTEIAVRANNIELLKLLLEYGADINAKCKTSSEERSLLSIACTSFFEDMIHLLIENEFYLLTKRIVL